LGKSSSGALLEHYGIPVAESTTGRATAIPKAELRATLVKRPYLVPDLVQTRIKYGDFHSVEV
jgi:hypothetical protein